MVYALHGVNYNSHMLEIRQTRQYAEWFGSLREKLTRQRVVVLLCGGDKSDQARDIQLAIQLAKEIE